MDDLIFKMTGITNVTRGVKPLKLTYLDDFQYLKEITNKDVLTVTDITTILESLND